MLARIKSSQLEGLKVPLVSSHTAFIRDDGGNGRMSGWMERIKKGGEMKCRQAKDGEKLRKTAFAPPEWIQLL